MPKLEMLMGSKLKVGFFGIGLDTYWPQFAGLRERLMGYLEIAEGKIAAGDVEVVSAGLVDNVEKANEAGQLFRSRDVDLIFLYITTYALSSTVLPAVQRAGVPVVVLNLQPVAALDYAAFNALGDRGKMTGEWLALCQACSAPEIACVFNRCGIDYHLITGVLENDPFVDAELAAWMNAARAARAMRRGRVGVLGHYYCGMLDVYSDMTQQSAFFGSHFELLEMCELHDLREAASEAAVKAKLEEFRTAFDVVPECSDYELARAAKTSCALDALVAAHRLTSMAYYYESTANNPYQEIVTSVIPGNTLLTAKGVPVAGECEIKNVQAMKIMDSLGAGGSFSEFYLMDFADDVVLLGHDGPAHAGIAKGRVSLVPLPVFHGKPGTGLSIQMSVKNGPVTLLSVVQDRSGALKLLFAEGESVEGPVMQIGNTNSRYRFSIGARRFVDEWSRRGPAHHCAIGLGHHGRTLEKLAAILGMEAIKVC